MAITIPVEKNAIQRASPALITAHKNWQARRDSNPQHPDLESGALAVRATGLHFGQSYFVSL